MKKLSINKMNEYPTINLDEQKMIKGGDIPWKLWKAFFKSSTGIPGIGQIGAAITIYEFITGLFESNSIDASTYYKLIDAANRTASDSTFVHINPDGSFDFKSYGNKGHK